MPAATGNNRHQEATDGAANAATDHDGDVHVETLEQIAERLGRSPERLAAAHANVAEPGLSNITDRDRARDLPARYRAWSEQPLR